jgi:hypothetical protein
MHHHHSRTLVWLLPIVAAFLVPTIAAAAIIGQLTDPPHPSIDASLDITAAAIEQTGGQLTFSITTRGPIPTSLPHPDDTMTYLWFADADENPATGQPHGGVGSDFNVRAVIGETYGGGFVDVCGGLPGGGGGTVNVTGNTISIKIWLSQIASPPAFNWRSASFRVISGVYGPGNPETGIAPAVTLPYVAPAHVAVTTPILELCPTGPATRRLEVVIRDASGNILPNEEHVLTFHSTNEAVATVDATGLVTAITPPQYHWQTPYIEVWADGMMADNSAVIRVNSSDLGVAHRMYPAAHVSFYLVPMIEGVDLDAVTTKYDVVPATDRAYEEQAVGLGTVPTSGGTEYFVLDVADDPQTAVCGASGNPIRLGWSWGQAVHNSCYIVNDPANRVPQWFVMWHEMGHNFTCACNSFNMFLRTPSDAHNGAYSEGLASLAAMWSWKAVGANPTGVGQTGLDNLNQHFQNYASNFRQRLARYQSGGADYSTIDPDIVDGILLEMFDQYGMKIWFDLFSSFLPSEQPLPLPLDTVEKQATWFVAAMSASTGQDLRSFFASEYGFPIDNPAWPAILSAVQARVAARTWTPGPVPGFTRGDVDASGELNISDAIYNLAYQFSGGPPPPCLDAADDDDSGEVNISDPIYSLNYQFAAGSPPPAPFPACGPDPTPDAIGCVGFPPCDDKVRPAPQASQVAEGSKRLLLETLPGTSPDTLSLKITVVTDVPLAGLEGIAGFDPSRLQFVRVARSESAPRMDFLSARDLTDPPRVCLGGVPDFKLAEVLAPGTYEIGRLIFARRGGPAGLGGAVWLAEGRFVGRDLRAYRIEGGPLVDPATPGVPGADPGAGLLATTLRVAPNPFTGSTTFHLCGPPATPARARIFDAAGRMVRTAWEGSLDGREMVVAWDGKDQSGRKVPAGIYLLRVESAAGEVLGRLVKTR